MREDGDSGSRERTRNGVSGAVDSLALSELELRLARMLAEGYGHCDAFSFDGLERLLVSVGLDAMVPLLEQLRSGRVSGAARSFSRLWNILEAVSLDSIRGERLPPAERRPLKGWLVCADRGGSGLEAVFRLSRREVPSPVLEASFEEVFDPDSISEDEWIRVLSDSSLREPCLKRLQGEWPVEARVELAGRFASSSNRLLAGAALRLCGDGASRRAAVVCVDVLCGPCGEVLALRCGEVLSGLSTSAAVEALSAALDSTGDSGAKARCLRAMACLGEAAFLEFFRKYEGAGDERMVAYSVVGRHRAGDMDSRGLKRFLTDPERHLLRCLCKMELYRSSELEKRYIVSEFSTGDPAAAAAMVEAASFFGNPRAVLDTVLDEMVGGKEDVRRQRSLQLSSLRTASCRHWFLLAARDVCREVAGRAIRVLVEMDGFGALRRYYDVYTAFGDDPSSLASDQHNYIRFHLLPLIEACPDCRFARYLAWACREAWRRGDSYEYERHLEPAVRSLGEAGVWEFSQLLYLPESEVSLGAEKVLLTVGGEAGRRALAAFRKGAPPLEVALRCLNHPQLREEAMDVLVEAGEEALPHLIPLLEESRSREAAFEVLGRLASPSSFPTILEHLGVPAHRFSEERSDESSTTGEASSPGGSSGSIRRRGFRDEDFLGRPVTSCVLAIGPPIAEGLASMLSAGAPDVRAHAAWLLGRIGASSAVPALVEALMEEGDERVASVIVRALGRLGAEGVTDSLLPLLERGGLELRMACCEVLGELGDEETLSLLEGLYASCPDMVEKRVLASAVENLRRKLSGGRG